MKTVVLINKTKRYLLREIKYLISKKPYFLNYPTATLCNHKCVMCNIHEIKKRDEVAIDDLSAILDDPLFDNIESIGLSGGEPFMKKDLVEVIETLLIKLKSLQNFSINSNGQLPNRIKEWLPEIKKLCAKHKVEFNVVLSMDGIGEIHNEVRGRPNAWTQMESSIGHVKENDIVPRILMTIHKKNYHDVFNVYAYSVNNGILPYFGVATVIERLGNEHIHDQFAINQKDRYYIWEFYQNLSKDKRFGINKRIWYDMLSYQLLYGINRRASCVAKNKGVYLSDSGKISYCGVYDKELKAFDHRRLLDRFRDKRNDLEVRQKMIEKHCNSCMHDYQSKPTFKDIYRFFINEFKIAQVKQIVKGEFYKVTHTNYTPPKKATAIKNILLYGWFGTETIGDKAIYSEIISFFKDKLGASVEFTIATKMIAYTERTLIELGLDNIDVININQISKTIQKYDLLVYCGGPIMGYSDLYKHYEIVNTGNRLGKYTMIYGAGISPISKKYYSRIAYSFIRQNDFIVVRDNESLSIVKEKIRPATSHTAAVIDPAYIWVLNQEIQKAPNEHPTLGISYRVLPNENYFKSTQETDKKIEIYAKIANEFIEEHDGKVVLIPMNTYHIGGDDRQALSQIKERITNKERVEILSGFNTPNETLQAFAKCDYFLGMRFHSSVFSNALNIPTVGVEYVLPKGKVTSLFNTLELQDNLINIQNLNYEILKEKLDNIIDNKNQIITHLKEKNEKLNVEYKQSLNSVLKDVI